MIVEGQPIKVQLPYFEREMTCIGDYPDGTLICLEALDGLNDLIAQKIDSDNQVMIVIRGATASGKSNLALRLMQKINPKFVLDDVYCYNLIDHAEKIKRGCTERINFFDEGSIAFNSLSTTSKSGRFGTLQ